VGVSCDCVVRGTEKVIPMKKSLNSKSSKRGKGTGTNLHIARQQGGSGFRLSLGGVPGKGTHLVTNEERPEVV